MCKMYYVSYETAKKELNLLPENESDDKIILLFCNQLVKTAVDEFEVDEEKKQKYLSKIVLKIFCTAKQLCDSKNNVNIENMSLVFDVLKETVIVM